MNIMIVTNSRYLMPTYIFLHSLFKNHIEIDMDIYLPYEDITPEELSDLSAFVESFGNKKLIPLYVGDEFKKRIISRNGIAVETYYRILGLELLPENVDKILYADVDMVVKADISPLYNTDITGIPFVVCEDIFGMINGFHEANKYRLSIPVEYSYFNAGVMLFNVKYLKENDSVSKMIDNIYKHFERYEYNDQDVMNEMFYDKLCYIGWDEYNCPPAWYYISKEQLKNGVLAFADYNDMQEFANTPELLTQYQNITEEIYSNARIIHYLGDTKPWSSTRKSAKIYDIFDRAYYEAKKELEEYIHGLEKNS